MLSDHRIALLAENGVNQRELTITREALERAGVKCDVVSSSREVKGFENGQWGTRFKTDKRLADVSIDDYVGAIIPGGVLHTDALRALPEADRFIRLLFGEGKLIGTVGHGAQVLINTEIIKGLKATGSPSIMTDLRHGGAVEQEGDVVIDNGIVTCRDDKHLDAFLKIFLDSLRGGVRQRAESII